MEGSHNLTNLQGVGVQGLFFNFSSHQDQFNTSCKALGSHSQSPSHSQMLLIWLLVLVDKWLQEQVDLEQDWPAIHDLICTADILDFFQVKHGSKVELNLYILSLSHPEV